MALRPVRGVLASENVQTGDGRVIAPMALEWPPLPLPLAWLERQMHGDLLDGGTQIGTIDTIVRVGDDATFTGRVDDAIPEGAELLRRMVEGSAPSGSRVGISIDPDNWAMELVDTTMDEADAEELVLLLASGSGPLVEHRDRQDLQVSRTLDQYAQGVQAAAGDPDPGEGVGVVLFTEATGDILERYTRLRIRGATACAIAAFVSGYMELAGDEPAEPAEPAEGAPTDAEIVAAASRMTPTPTQASRPPAEWFNLPEPQPGQTDRGEVYGMPVQELLVEQPDGGLGVPLTITDDGRVFGHIARWEQCHVGYLDECVTAPMSNAAYAHFHVGETVCAAGERLATGVLTVNTDHAAAHLLAPDARDHYAHTGLGYADVRASNGALGAWCCGALRDGFSDAQIRVLRASSASGDWRRIGPDLELIAALAVNVPGFPIAREAVTASGMRLALASLTASAYMVEGRANSLVASGIVHRCADCQRRAMADRGPLWMTEGGRVRPAPEGGADELLELVRKVELRTRHLVPAAADHARSRMQRR